MKLLDKQHVQFPNIDRLNNFNLIRLLAALQVAFSHTASHFEIKLPQFFTILDFFPGVPIFFTVSGFLITNSFIQKPFLKEYALNRALRIFPALWVCFIITVAALLYFRVIDISAIASLSFIKWTACQLSFLQFYTPDYLRSWGVGTPNGSLWTITIELQFYVLLPVILAIALRKHKKAAAVILLLVFIASVCINRFYFNMGDESMMAKLLHVSLLPYLHYFMIGIAAFLLWKKAGRFFIGKAMWWFIAFIGYVLIAHYWLQLYLPNYYPNFFGWISLFLLSCCVISFAFTWKGLSGKLIGENDISYGVYIYHMIVINSIISLGIQSNHLLLTLSITIILAFISWKLIEAPALRLKKKFKNNRTAVIK